MNAACHGPPQVVLGPMLQRQSGLTPTSHALCSAKVVGLYFGAGWCAPCKAFAARLKASYVSSLVKKGLHVVFVSWDKDEQGFGECFGPHPWSAVPFGEADRREALARAQSSGSGGDYSSNPIQLDRPRVTQHTTTHKIDCKYPHS